MDQPDAVAHAQEIALVLQQVEGDEGFAMGLRRIEADEAAREGLARPDVHDCEMLADRARIEAVGERDLHVLRWAARHA